MTKIASLIFCSYEKIDKLFHVEGGGKVGGAYVSVPSLTTVQSKGPNLNR